MFGRQDSHQSTARSAQRKFFLNPFDNYHFTKNPKPSRALKSV
jgi:hypothetical protein